MQAQGQLDYAKSQLDATVIRAPVTGTILDRTAEKGELITAQFASAAAGGPQGSVVSLADLNDLQVELDIAQADFARLSPNQKGDGHHRRLSGQAVRRRDRANFSGSEPAESYGAGEGAGAASRQVSGHPTASGDERDGDSSWRTRHRRARPKTRRACSFRRPALRDKDGKKIVLIASTARAVAREVHVRASARTESLVDGLVGGENVITTAPADFERRGQNQNQGAIMSTVAQTNIATGTKVVQVRGVSKIFKRDAFQVHAL